MEPLRIGIVGCGAISGIYLDNLGKFAQTEVVAVADLDLERAKAVAERKGVAKALTTDELLADSDVELVLNLTVPKAHGSVAFAAVEAGKHVYNEKPLCISNQDAERLVVCADQAGVAVGCAPDTFLGAGHQTCRKLIDDGAIGTPIAGHAFMLCRGHETWHPSPEFYYEQGGGPMLDMGPYYVTALINMLGPVMRVTGLARASFPTRTITSQPKHGKVVPVETPTHLSGEMEFQGGAIVHLTTSFDVFPHPLPHIIVYGSEGTLIVPDPNGFGGDVLLKRGHADPELIPHTHAYPDNTRGLGVLDMAIQIREGGQAHRASGALASHALGVMNAFEESSRTAAHVAMRTLPPRPAPMPAGGFG